jgi:hypothetical protein
VPVACGVLAVLALDRYTEELQY